MCAQNQDSDHVTDGGKSMGFGGRMSVSHLRVQLFGVSHCYESASTSTKLYTNVIILQGRVGSSWPGKWRYRNTGIDPTYKCQSSFASASGLSFLRSKGISQSPIYLTLPSGTLCAYDVLGATLPGLVELSHVGETDNKQVNKQLNL